MHFKKVAVMIVINIYLKFRLVESSVTTIRHTAKCWYTIPPIGTLSLTLPNFIS